MHRYVLEQSDLEDLRVFVVWGPMLNKETEEDARQATATVADPKAIHFWTDDDRVGELFQQALGFTDEEEQGWDTFTVFRPGVEWQAGPPPEPDYYMHFDKPLPEEREIDAITLQREIERIAEAGAGQTSGQ